MDRVQAIIRQVVELDTGLETWYEKLVAWSPCPIYWEEEPQLSQDSPEEPRRVISFPNLRLCHMMLDFWSLHTIASTVMTAPALWAKLSPYFQALLALVPFAERVARHNHSFILELGTLTMDDALYSLRPGMGLCGPHHTIFGLRVAMFSFRLLPGKYAAMQNAKCEALMHMLADEKGLDFARDLSSPGGEGKNQAETMVEMRNYIYYQNPGEGKNM